jgi:serine/threonine protein phosphatase PrpC
VEEKTIVCPHCGTGNTPTSKFCSHCAERLPKPAESPLILKAGEADTVCEPESKPAGEHDAPTVRNGSLSQKQRRRLQTTARGEPDLIVRSEVNRREQNEDSFQVYDLLTPAAPGGLQVLAVADGMGGHAYGEHVSREVLRTVSRALFEQCVVLPTLNELAPPFLLDAQKMSEILWQTLEEANARVQQMVRSNKWGKAGSTLVIGVILQNTLIAANLGDSPLFVYRHASQSLKKITEDHTVAGILVRKKLIPPEMARFHEGRSRLEFYVGADTLPKHPPLYQCTLAAGDLVLLCSDGISGCLMPDQMEKLISEATDDLKAVADRLIEAALATDETDNQTLILWRSHPTTS